MPCSFSRRLDCLTTLAISLALVTSTVFAAPGGGKGGGKGGGGSDGDGGGSSTSVPVQYQVIWASQSVDGRAVHAVNAMNDDGKVVGALKVEGYPQYRAFLWDMTGLRGIDALAADEIPDGWIANVASDINTSGRVVGKAIHVEQEVSRPFIYDETLTPKFQLLPGPAQSVSAINDSGDVVYMTPDPVTGEFIGYVYEYDPIDGYQNPDNITTIPLAGILPEDINSWGQVVGTLREPGSSVRFGAFRYTPGASQEIEIWPSGDTGIAEASSINDAGWFVGRLNREAFRFDGGLTLRFTHIFPIV